MKKNNSSDPSNFPLMFSLPQIRQEDLLLPVVLESIPSERNYDLKNKRLFGHQ